MTRTTLAIALGLVLGGTALGSAQAQEQGIRPVPEDLARQPVDERTEDTMPYPKGSVQGAESSTPAPVQDALAEEDDEQLLEDESDAETASTDVSDADEAAAADNLAGRPALPAEVEARFRTADANGDGMLGEAELRALDDTLVFATLDADGSGAVSRDEWRAQIRTHAVAEDGNDDD